MDLLRWFRFLWALGVGWDQATRIEARDFCRWLQVAVKPTRLHWRYPDDDLARSGRSRSAPEVNAVTGKPARGEISALESCWCTGELGLKCHNRYNGTGGSSLDEHGHPAPRGNVTVTN